MDRIRLDFKQNEKKKKRKERKIVKSSTFFPATEKELGELENTRAEKNSPSQHLCEITNTFHVAIPFFKICIQTDPASRIFNPTIRRGVKKSSVSVRERERRRDKRKGEGRGKGGEDPLNLALKLIGRLRKVNKRIAMCSRITISSPTLLSAHESTAPIIHAVTSLSY